MNIIITGASSGIGYSCAKVFAQNGFDVFACIRDTDNPPSFPEKVKNKIKFIKMDISSDESVKEAVCQMKTITDSKIDILINNAGQILFGSIEETSIQQAIDLFEVNYFGHLRVIKEIVPLMREKRNGVIFNIASFSALFTIPFASHYASSKSALVQATYALRQELLPFNIQVSAILPGWIKTPLAKKSMQKNNQALKYGSPYDNSLNKVKNVSFESVEKGMLPDILAKKILKLTSKKNLKPRYLFAKYPEALLPLIARFSPKTLEENLSLSYFGIKKTPGSKH